MCTCGQSDEGNGWRKRKKMYVNILDGVNEDVHRGL